MAAELEGQVGLASTDLALTQLTSPAMRGIRILVIVVILTPYIVIAEKGQARKIHTRQGGW